MNLVKCAECGGDISEHATQCPHCGHGVKHGFPCRECGTIIDKDMEFCPTCGCPLSKQKNITIADVALTKAKKYKKLNQLLIIVAVIIALAVAGAIVYYNYNKQVTPEEYVSIVKETSQRIMDLTDLVYESNGLITEAWLKEDDDLISKTGLDSYRDGEHLTELFDNDLDFREGLRTIRKEEREIVKIMNRLPDPPLGYEDAETELRDLYADLLYLNHTVISPEGTIDDYVMTLFRINNEMKSLYEGLADI